MNQLKFELRDDLWNDVYIEQFLLSLAAETNNMHRNKAAIP